MLAQGSATYAHGPHHGGRYFQQGGNFPQAPQLTPEQMEKAKQIFGNSSGKIDSLLQTLATKQNELNSELAKPSPANEKVVELSREIGEIQGKLVNERNAIHAQMAKEGIPAPAAGQAPCAGNCFNGAPYAPCAGPWAMPCNAGNAPMPCPAGNLPWGGYMHGPRHGW